VVHVMWPTTLEMEGCGLKEQRHIIIKPHINDRKWLIVFGLFSLMATGIKAELINLMRNSIIIKCKASRYL
jgi:hypothetical protein